jgi:hypothetical protein
MKRIDSSGPSNVNFLFVGIRGRLILRPQSGKFGTSELHAAQYTLPVPRWRSHNPPHRSQYLSSNRMISQSAISITASISLSRGSAPAAAFLVPGPEVCGSMKKALDRRLGHRARFSYG